MKKHWLMGAGVATSMAPSVGTFFEEMEASRKANESMKELGQEKYPASLKRALGTYGVSAALPLALMGGMALLPKKLR